MLGKGERLSDSIRLYDFAMLSLGTLLAMRYAELPRCIRLKKPTLDLFDRIHTLS
jgi:hypothetical protein